MEHSDELRDLTLRLYEAEATGDLSFIERNFSRQEGAVYVGSDPNEWWEGFEAFVEAMRAQSEAMGGMQIVAGQLQAYREGNVGWSIGPHAFVRPPMEQRYPSVIPASSFRRRASGKRIHGTPLSTERGDVRGGTAPHP